MLTTFQAWTKSWVAKIFLSVLAFSFVAFLGWGDLWNAPSSRRTIAFVGQETISLKEFTRFYQQQPQVFLSTTQNTSLSSKQQQDFVNTALRQLVEQKMLDQEVASLGLHISNEAVREDIKKNPLFHDKQGVFSEEKLYQFLQNTGASEKDYLKSVKKKIGRFYLEHALVGTLPLPESALKMVRQSLYQKRWGVCCAVGGKGPFFANQSPQEARLFLEVTSPKKPEETVLKNFYASHKALFEVPFKCSFLVVALEDKNTQEPLSYEKRAEIEDSLAAQEPLQAIAKQHNLPSFFFSEDAIDGLLNNKKAQAFFNKHHIDGPALIHRVVNTASQSAPQHISRKNSENRVSNKNPPFMVYNKAHSAVVHVVGAVPGKILDFSQVKEKAYRLWEKETCHNKLLEGAQNEAKKIEKSTTVPSSFSRIPWIALNSPLPHMNQQIQGALFYLKKGQARAMEIYNGDKKEIWIVKLMGIETPAATVPDAVPQQNIEEMVKRIFSHQLMEGYMMTLKKRYPVRFNDNVFQEQSFK